MTRIFTVPGQTRCYQCRTTIVESKDLDVLLHALGTCPNCQSELVGYIRPTEWLRCTCGGRVDLVGFTNPCPDCPREYNRSGQLLADRSQWGEETGEHPADIGRIP